MNPLKSILLVTGVAAASMTAAERNQSPDPMPHGGGSRGAMERSTNGFRQFRTDINPALRYYQAFLEMPKLSNEDHKDLFVREWRGQPLDDRFGELVSRYDIEFRLLREAAHAEVPCDWGIDLTAGPDALLPALASAKAVAQVTRFRVMWHLKHGRQSEAREDLLAAFTLARNVSRDGVLVSALVQMAMENIIESVVAENFFQWPPETLREIVNGLNAAPARGTIAQCVAAEKLTFHDWLLRKIQELRQGNAGDEAKALEQVVELLARIGGEGGPDKEFAARVLEAGGGTLDGVIRQVRELGPIYNKVTALMNLSHDASEEQLPEFMSDVDRHANPLVPKLFRVFGKCRTKEFSASVKQAMIQAGIEYKLRGEAGLQSVTDPCGKGPFTMRRFQLNGEDRGFELKSTFDGPGHPVVLIFIEKNGTPFMIDGKNAGKPYPTSN